MLSSPSNTIYVADFGLPSGRDDKEKALHVLEDITYSTSVSIQEEVIYLHKFKFKKTLVQDEGYSSDEASEEWTNCLNDADVDKHMDKKGRTCIPIDGSLKVIAARTAEKRNILSQRHV